MTCSHSPSRRPNLVHFKLEVKGGVNDNDFSYFRAFFVIWSLHFVTFRTVFVSNAGQLSFVIFPPLSMFHPWPLIFERGKQAAILYSGVVHTGRMLTKDARE
jgi:hypothetical protein